MDAGIHSFSSSEVWLRKADPNSLCKITEVLFDDSDVISRTDIQEELEAKPHIPWTKYDLPVHLLSWSITDDFSVLTLQITCQSTDPDESSVPIVSGDDKPFFIARTGTAKGPSRNRRSVDCVEDSTACCRETFYLNFSEIGWDNWILHPEGYYANFCRGRCLNDLSATRFYHSAVLISYIQDNDDIAAEMGLTMCCTPSIMSPISILYMNEEGLIYHKSIENMRVEACDCA